MIVRHRLFTLLALVTLVSSLFVGSNAMGPAHAAGSRLMRSAQAPHDTATQPTSVTIASDFQQQLGCSGNWAPDCPVTHMTYDANSDVWRGQWTISAGSYNYKAALNDSWNVNYGLHATPGGANIPLTLSTSTAVTFYYDNKTNWVTDNVNSIIASAPGNYQHFLGCSSDWDPSCLRSWLEDPKGTGTYSFSTTAIPAGSYQVKVALNESWTVNYGQGGQPGGANIPFTVSRSGTTVTFSYNPTTHVLTVNTGPHHGHDNNVEYDGLAHDSRNSLYRVPFGAVNPGTPVTLRFRTFHNDVTGVTVRFYDTSIGHENREPMTLVAQNVSCYDAALDAAGNTCDFYQDVITPTALATVYYRFIATDGTATAYYADTSNRYDGLGVATPDEQDNGFRINVVDPKFKVIPWMQNGVMYQIFPDRFYNGDPTNDPKPTDPRYAYPAPPNATPQQLQDAANAQIINKKWSDLPEGYCRNYVNPATPCTQQPLGRDYFGGDLLGVDKKLDYLHHLGITILYLNPIFESGSNHGYDTRDYQTINHYFGSNGYFKHLVSDASSHGIQIILDGVFNHLSSDSPFFDRYHHYSTVGACEDIHSPYRSWFTFHDVTPGTGVCVDSQNRPNSATYDGWSGFDSIPVITKQDPVTSTLPYCPVSTYFYGMCNGHTVDAGGGIVGRWLSYGTKGWRFDVMTDPSFPTAYWQQVRSVAKGITPDATLIAEAWHWYDNLPLTHGDQADTAMGYRFRNAVLGLLGATDNKGFPQETDPNLPVSTFATRIMSMREDYADATWYTFQNLLDSHDTARILWSVTPGQNNRENKEFNAANLALGKLRERMAALVQMTLPGTPSIYYGDEVSLTGDDDPDNRRPFPWKLNPDGSYAPVGHDTSYYGAAGDHSTFDWYRQLIAVRTATPALRQGALTFLFTNDANQTLAYAMRGDNSTTNSLAIVVLNRSETLTQTIPVTTAGYLRDGVTFTDALGQSPAVTTTYGSFSVTLAPLGAAIYVMTPGQNITGPAPVTGLVASAQNGLSSQVALTWTANAASASYNVYRSPVQGGGYIKIGSTTATTFTDSTVANGTTYYYVVRGIDSPGNEGGASNEANATPAFPIGYAVLQYPKSISETITATPTTVYGRVYVQGLTDSAGDPGLILAQVGFGAHGSDPGTWTWQPMTYNPGHTGDNNYEYMGTIRADAPGSYDYLVRFSDDGGRSWIYGDTDGYVPPGTGTNSGTNAPGQMTILPSSDTTAPSAPVVSIDWSASRLTLSWTPSSDPDDAVAEYRIYRGTSAGGEGSTALAIVPATTTVFTDTTVSSGVTYYYVVKAYDTSLNASPASNEVFHQVAPKIVQVTFRVKVPSFTPPGDVIYITGNSGLTPDPLCNYCGGGTAATAMTETVPGSKIWQTTIGLPDGTQIQYKYTRGNYNYVEEWGSIRGFTNRVATVQANSSTDLTQLMDDTSDTYPDDNHKAVQNWRDALVTATSPANGATGVAATTPISVSFNWDVQPANGATDFSTAIGVTRNATAIAGTVTHNSATQSLTFTPAAPLASGTYTVTVNNVSSLTVQSDGIAIRSPYTFTFSVP